MSDSKLFQPPSGESQEHAYHTSLEQTVNRILTPFQRYAQSQITASFFLVVCTVIALIWASLPYYQQFYTTFTTTSIGFHVANFEIEKSLQFWVNDVLLTLFFFVVGLEIKRELLVGELANPKQATFVLATAAGGMIVPAVIYLLFNYNTLTQHGWGIPMATDTAFALGILACFKNQLPKGAFTFIAALAIIDDIGAILVIAFFYSGNVNTNFLFIGFLLMLVICFINYAGFRRPLAYIFLGICFWVSIELAGIHGTIAGILLAFLIPARPRKGPNHFIKKSKSLLKYFESRKIKNPTVLEDAKQHAALEEMQEMTKEATTPLQRWESKLELPIALLILPLFALVNAGIPINIHLVDEVFTHYESLGIIFGLVIGKPLGISFFAYIVCKCKLGDLPSGISLNQIIGISFLAGIGFTMSLFIANLGFAGQEQSLLLAKAAILFGSLTAAIVGGGYLLLVSQSTTSLK